VLSLGRIHWIKGLDFLVKGFSEVAGARSDVVLAIVGNDDGYKRTLDKLIGELELSDRVFFTGFLSGVDKLSALVDADVMVQTSRYEQGAWAPFEAVLCGTPIIVNGDTGAGENVKQADAGYLVEYGNTNNLRDNIQYVLDNSVEARKKTQKAEEYIKSNLSLEREIEKYEKLYQESIEKCNPACQST
jgi:glycosyltransferase involved in cell wall biosynthesis